MKRVRRTPVDAGGVRAEWFQPVHGHGEEVVLYLHGGSFMYGSLTSHGELITRLALAAHARVLALDYRLVPEATFPAPIDDTIAAYRWLLGQGVPPGRIVLAGDSAGGNLSVTALLALRERGEPLPAGAIPICPWVDPPRTGGSLDENERFDWGLAADFPQWCAFYAGVADPAQPLISPIHADLAGLPPLCVLWGECEMLRDQVVDFVTRAQAAGVDVTARAFPDMVHNWMTLHAFTPEAEKAFAAMGAFVQRVTGA
jgi:acetyl esterase/lipase